MLNICPMCGMKLFDLPCIWCFRTTERSQTMKRADMWNKAENLCAGDGYVMVSAKDCKMNGRNAPAG